MNDQQPDSGIISGGPSGRLKPWRVLIVAPSLDILGGQAVQAARLMSRLQQLSSLEVGFLPINPRLPGVLRKLQAVKYLRTLVTTILYCAKLLIQVRQYDTIHIFSASYFSFVLAPTPAILVGKLYGKRVLLNYHSGEAEDHLERWPSAIKTIRLADEIAVPSEYLVRVLARFGLQARAINNLIELDEFAFRERAHLRPVFLSNRNLETHYGVDLVLRAFALIQAEFPQASLTVAGDGSQRSALETLSGELALRNTKFIGRVGHERIAELYESADIYLNGSQIDNQPLSILEAFAAGLPVVTTDAGGIPDMVEDGATGFVISRDDYQGMAHRALQLLADPELAKEIATSALEQCEKYSWEAVREEWVGLYSRLAKNPSHGSSNSGKLGKLKTLTFSELRMRCSQAFAVFWERQGWARSAKLPDDRTFQKLFHHSFDEASSSEISLFSQEAKFFSSFVDPAETVAELRNRWPEGEAGLIAAADQILTGRFDLLGYRDLQFGDPINWHLEPCAGKSTPMIHWSLIDYLNPDVAGDKKIIWELNRHQYFVTLGQAYWLTKDEKYAEAFARHLESWMDANPPKIGINWASSLEIAFRSISWLWAFHFFKDSPSLSPAVVKRALKFLFLNARHLETYLSTYFSPNTHLTGEALGLFYLGTLLPEFREAKRWRDRGQEILIEQLAQQVKPDGVYFEQSSYYHRYTVDFYTHFLVLSQLNGVHVSSYVTEKLNALLDHLMYITRPDGTTPFFGDDDGGRLMLLDRRPGNDFRASLSTGATLFNRGDYKFVASNVAEETLWLLGTQALQTFDRIEAHEPVAGSKAFPDGGYYVMRDGWHKEANYLLFDCGAHGAKNCGHAHADALAIEVAVNGRPQLVDPGTYSYTASASVRDWFRSSRAHNVLLVDGAQSSLPAGPFSWRSIAKSKSLSWISERRFDYAEGTHDGYERLHGSPSHTRSILFVKGDYWLLLDRLTSEAEHELELVFHFASDSNPELVSEGREKYLAEKGRDDGLTLFSWGSEGRWSREEGWVSHSYGERVSAPVWAFSANSKGSAELVTLLVPTGRKGKSLVTAKEIEAIGGRAFEITSEGHSDLVLIRNPDSTRVETVRVVSDFTWTWARFATSGAELPEELVVLDGQKLELDARPILNSTKRAGYLAASRVGQKFRFQTDEGELELSLPVSDLESVLAEVGRRALTEK